LEVEKAYAILLTWKKLERNKLLKPSELAEAYEVVWEDLKKSGWENPDKRISELTHRPQKFWHWVWINFGETELAKFFRELLKKLKDLNEA